LPSIKAVAWLCVAASIGAFVLGLVLARIYLCRAPGPLAFLASFAFCCLGALVFWVAAWRNRSWRLALGGFVVLGLALALQFLSLSVTLPGCSGV
jgi:hypothetical protein